MSDTRPPDPAHAASAAESAAMAAADPAARVRVGLRQLLLDAHPSAQNIALHGLCRSAGGLSRENWSFDATWTDAQGEHHHRLMLMRDAAGTLLHTDRARECAVLKALEHTAVPAPPIFWMDEQGLHLGAPSVVMARMPGVCDYMVLNGQAPLAARLSLAQDFLALMATIHAVDWRALGLGERLGVPEGAPSLRDLAHWEGEYRKAQIEPHPELDYVLSWLRQRAPQAEAVVLVHGDFKPGNALIDQGRITAKLDWETAQLGDPLEDLGWVTNPVRKREHQIPGHWERREMVQAYRERTGRQVAEADLLWWNVFSCWKLSIIQLTAVAEFVAGRYHRVFQTPTWLYRPMFQMMEAAS